ncbi:MFS transporter [Amycolatopsis thailandensis]|nr:MFS transporter [Amycolatopsis thailandensis]
MTTVNSSSSPEGVESPQAADPRRWWALILLCGLQAMILLDMTVVNVALPRIQQDLGFTESGLAWVVNGYVLMAGGLLILGGRLADVFGRRRLLLTGVAIFAISSALSGFAVAPWMMVIGRFGQGIAEAIAAPAALGLIALLFHDPKERTKALGLWGGIIALAGTLGYVISGVLTDLASWEWLFFINLPVALVVLVLLPRLVNESRMVRENNAGLDIAGALTLTLGLVGVVYGLLHAAEHPWGSALVMVPLVGGVVLLVATVLIERRAKNPLIPLDFFANRTRSAINFVTLFFMAAFISYTFMMTLFAQKILGYSPLQGGLAWLPLGLGIGAGIGLGTGLIPKLGVKVVASVGYVGAGAGLFITSMVDLDSSYVGGLMPGMIVFGLFAGATMPAATNAALHGVTVQDSSLASGVQSTMQQVGSALGLAVLVTVAIRYAGDAIATGADPRIAMTEGYTLAFRIGAALMVLGGILIAVLFEKVATELRDPTAERLEVEDAA